MKKIIFAIAFLFVFVLSLNAQNLYRETYSTLIKDSIAVSSTNAGSDWFTNDNKNNNNIWITIHNGADWFAYKIDFPCQLVSKLKAYHYGADSSFAVMGYLYNGISVLLPIKYGAATTPKYKITNSATTRWMVQFLATKD